MPTETKRAKFEVVTCRADHVKFIDVDIPAEYNDVDGDDLCYEYGHEVLSAAGITNHICEGCYDHAYRVNFVEWVESSDYVADYVI